MYPTVKPGFYVNILAAWLILIAVSYVTVYFIAPVTLGEGYLARLGEGILKASAVAVLLIGWLYIWKTISRWYFRRLAGLKR